MPQSSFKLLSFQDKFRVLHLSWIAFFISFVVWFNHAPLLASIREALDLSSAQINALLVLNVALTIPARIVIGMLVDSFGPKRVYSLLLVAGGVLCIAFSMSTTFEQLALTRFLLGFVGAGFVVGIRLISEWFPAREVGLAEGIYGGWGNFGSAFAALSLPALALVFGGDDGWRYAIGTTGVIAMIYSVVFYFGVSDTPKGSTYFKPKRNGAMEVTSKGDFVLYVLMNLPLFAALGLIVWQLGPNNLGLFGTTVSLTLYGVILLICAFQMVRIAQINGHVFVREVPEFDRYKFKQVAMLNLVYMATFGSELAVVSMLPLFFLDTFGLSQLAAGLLGGSFAIMNLIARPGGGLVADKIGRKRATVYALIGVIIGYALMSMINAAWPVVLAVLVVVACSIFVQAGCGTVYAAVPLIKRRLTGQVAGMAGAYGNVGGVLFLTVLALISPQIFSLVLGLCAAAVLGLVLVFMEEPQPQTTEVMPDGTMKVIEVH